MSRRLRWNFNDFLSLLRNKFKFLQLATHQNSVITVAFANCVFFSCFQTIVVTKTAKMFPRSNRWQQKWKPKRFTFCSRWESWFKKSVWKHFLLQEGLTDLANKCLVLFIHIMGNSEVNVLCDWVTFVLQFWNGTVFFISSQCSSKYDYFHCSFQVEDSSDVLLRAQKGHKSVRKCIYFFCSWISLIRPPLGHENMVVLKAWSYIGRTNIVLRGGGRLGNFQIKKFMHRKSCWKKR